MRFGRLLLPLLLLVATSCRSASAGDSTATTNVVLDTEVTGSGAPDIHGKPCKFGTTVVPSVTLGLGPLSVTSDAEGNLSFGLSGTIVAFGPLSLGASLGTAGEHPSCVTLALVDSARKRTHYIAIEPGAEHVLIRGGGRFDERVEPGLVTIETSQLCELQIFTGSQDVPKRRPGCGGAVGLWTLTDSSYNARAQAEVRVKQLQAAGVAAVGTANSDDWPSVCPPFFIVYVGQFSSRDAAEQKKAALQGVLYKDAYSRFLSTDTGDRPERCPT